MDNKRRVPRTDEISHLTHLGVVAFAARCARRVQPLTWYGPSKQPMRHVEVLDKAIDLAESFASGRPIDKKIGSLSHRLETSLGEMDSARAHMNSPKSVLHAPMAAKLAFDAIHDASLGPDLAFRAALMCASVYLPLEGTGEQAIWDAIRSDFNLALRARFRESWTDETPIPPEFFGPMWPNGEPEAWPEDAKRQPDPRQSLELRIAIPPTPDAPEAREALKARIINLLSSANAVHLASGGSGLEIAGAKVYAKVGVPQGADA